MAEEAPHELIIIRRHEEEEHEHHSSAWKVAHADFMTAMMAFFLIMWLVNVTDDEMRKGISQYFNPIHLSEGSTELKGLNQPDPSTDKAKDKTGHSEKPTGAVNPIVLSRGNADAASLATEQNAAVAAATASAAAAAATATSAAGQGPAPSPAAVATAAPAQGTSPGEAADQRERAAFQDPYAVLAKLAQQYTAQRAMSLDTADGDDRQPGVAGGEVDRDPFDPTYWQVSAAPAAVADKPGSPLSTAPIPVGVTLDALAPDRGTATAPLPAEPPAKSAAAPPADVAVSPPPTPAPAAIASEIIAAGEALQTAIQHSVEEIAAADAAPEVSVKATAEGVLINLTDDATFSMFGLGSAIPDPQVVVLMDKIAKLLATEKGDVIIRGYTDGRPFHSESYDNWRLSAGRAHMAYYMLTRGGLDEKRVVSIEGRADRDLKNPKDPLAPENRRIEIILKRGAG